MQGKRMRELREERKLTQAALAAMVGVAPTSVSAWEAGHSFPRRKKWKRLARALGVTVADLTGGES